MASDTFDCCRRQTLFIAIAFFLWLVPSLNEIWKYTGEAGLLILSILGLSAIRALGLLASRCGESIPRIWLAVICVMALGLFALLFPIAHSGILGPGSDRDDALNVALQALLAGHYPYDVTTYLGNPPTPMPGALILALPFYLFGTSALQNLAWMLMLIWWSVRHFGSSTIAASFLLIFLLGCPASLEDFVVGGDYFINAIYVAIAMDAMLCADSNGKTWQRYAAMAFLSIAISSRPIYALAVPVLAGTIFRSHGPRRVSEFLLTVCGLCMIVNGPYFIYDPSRFPITHLTAKISELPKFLHAAIVLPAIGMAIASLSFFVPMTRDRVFLLMAAALSVIFYPLFVYELATKGLGSGAMTAAAFSLPVTIFGGLWVCHELCSRTSSSVNHGTS